MLRFGAFSLPVDSVCVVHMGRDQLDFFQDDSEADLFGPDYEPPVYHADPDEVRAELNRILGEARAANTVPWDAPKTRLYQTIFPQMSQWLPEEEGQQLCFAFEAELERLKAA